MPDDPLSRTTERPEPGGLARERRGGEHDQDPRITRFLEGDGALRNDEADERGGSRGTEIQQRREGQQDAPDAFGPGGVAPERWQHAERRSPSADRQGRETEHDPQIVAPAEGEGQLVGDTDRPLRDGSDGRALNRAGERDAAPQAVLPSQDAPESLPRQSDLLQRRSPLERHQPLPTIGPDGTWSSGGLLESVGGEPVDQFLRDLAADRHDQYLDGRGTQDLSKAQVGPVFSVLVDRRTGALYEGTNTMVADRDRIPADLHPVLQERLDALIAEAEANPARYEYASGERGGFPHFSTPGTHAEVQAADRALRDRELRGLPVDAGSLNELTVQSHFLEGPKRGMDAPSCPNCTALLPGADNLAGSRQVDEMRR